MAHTQPQAINMCDTLSHPISPYSPILTLLGDRWVEQAKLHLVRLQMRDWDRALLGNPQKIGLNKFPTRTKACDLVIVDVKTLKNSLVIRHARIVVLGIHSPVGCYF